MVLASGRDALNIRNVIVHKSANALPALSDPPSHCVAKL